MPPLDETDSELRLYLYHVVRQPGPQKKPSDVWHADQDQNVEEGRWDEIPGGYAVGAYWIVPLAELFAPEGTERLIQRVRAALRQQGIALTDALARSA
ncbi:hypothetical protein ACFSHQ_02990 [Gemmobacter lanyuensis]